MRAESIDSSVDSKLCTSQFNTIRTLPYVFLILISSYKVPLSSIGIKNTVYRWISHTSDSILSKCLKAVANFTQTEKYSFKQGFWLTVCEQ